MNKLPGIKYWFAGCLLVCCAASLAAEQRWYFVRHFEKLAGHNPGLTVTGHQRAEALAAYFAHIPLSKIYSTDYDRTRQSVQPLAQLLGINVEYYSESQLTELAEGLGAQNNILVMGHSNTTPQLVRLMGGEAEDMAEQDYGRLLIIRKNKQSASTQTLMISVAH